MLAAMSGHARSFLACVLVTLVSAPVTAAWAAPPGATVPAPRAPDAPSWAAYEASKKDEGIAIVLELVVPGVGSIYAGHWKGAAITWSMTLVGSYALMWGAFSTIGGGETSARHNVAIAGGAALAIGGRIYGVINSFRSAQRYNRGLARRLGLNHGLVLTPIPLHVDGQTTLGLGASWQF
jgi:hypothetical protein